VPSWALPLGEHRDIQAAGLGRHQLVGAVLEDAQERDDARRGIVRLRRDLGHGLVQVGDVGGGIPV
jgi:hypothetical protein